MQLHSNKFWQTPSTLMVSLSLSYNNGVMVFSGPSDLRFEARILILSTYIFSIYFSNHQLYWGFYGWLVESSPLFHHISITIIFSLHIPSNKKLDIISNFFWPLPFLIYNNCMSFDLIYQFKTCMYLPRCRNCGCSIVWDHSAHGKERHPLYLCRSIHLSKAYEFHRF